MGPKRSPPPVRSWNATDSASSVSDRYRSSSNQTTLFGIFIATPTVSLANPRSFGWELKPDLTIAVGILAPVLAHLHEQEQMHGLLDDLGDFLAGVCANRFD